MAVLTDNDRKAAWEQWMRENTEACSVSKADLRAALNAVDAWVDSNASSFNTAIPQPARAALTAAQKARLLLYVVGKRFLVS